MGRRRTAARSSRALALAEPRETKPESAPRATVCQVPSAARYCAWKRTNISSAATPSPGIDARTPIVAGWSGVSHTLTVAHSSMDCATAGVVVSAAPEAGTTASASAATTTGLMWKRRLMTGIETNTATPYSTRRTAQCDTRHMAPDTTEVVALLAAVPVFDGLGLAELSHVADVADVVSFPPHTTIFREGDPSDTCYVVHSGHLRALREHSDGRRLALAHLGPGDAFGELAMFDDERRSATVETLDDVEAVVIAGGDMRGILDPPSGDGGADDHRPQQPPAPGPTSASCVSPFRPSRAAWPRRSAS